MSSKYIPNGARHYSAGRAAKQYRNMHDYRFGGLAYPEKEYHFKDLVNPVELFTALTLIFAIMALIARTM